MSTEKSKIVEFVVGDQIKEVLITDIPDFFPDKALTCSSDDLVRMFDRYMQNNPE